MAATENDAEATKEHAANRFVGLLLLVALLTAFTVDLPVAAFCRPTGAPRSSVLRFIDEFLENAETFGHGSGVALIVTGVFVLDPRRRKEFPLLLAGSYGAGLVASILKLAVVRTRPRSLPILPDTVWSTFGGFFSTAQSNETQSFPSGHTSTAVGLAMMLSGFYPQGRWYFTGLAILVGMQRIHTESHFPSDVFAGAIVGWSMAAVCQFRSREKSISSP